MSMLSISKMLRTIGIALSTLRQFQLNRTQRLPYHAVVYEKYGDPATVLTYANFDTISHIGPDEISVKIQAATVNPSDINTIEGTYPLKPPDPEWRLPAVAGHEGVGQVMDCGKDVKGLKSGDRVLPLVSRQGTWTEMGVYKSHFWHKIPDHLPIEAAAALTVKCSGMLLTKKCCPVLFSPPTALCLLRDFAQLQSGDVVVQNGANSAVGRAVIEIAKMRGIHTINIVRDRPMLKHLTDELRDLGGTLVAKEEDIETAFNSSGLPKGSLGLNCIGGTSASLVSKLLKSGSTLVTYGGMSKEPLKIPTSALIFKDLTYKGFWWSGHTSKKLGIEGKAKVIDEIVDMVQLGHLTIKTMSVPLADYKEALKRQAAPHRNHKILLIPK